MEVKHAYAPSYRNTQNEKKHQSAPLEKHFSL